MNPRENCLTGPSNSSQEASRLISAQVYAEAGRQIHLTRSPGNRTAPLVLELQEADRKLVVSDS